MICASQESEWVSLDDVEEKEQEEEEEEMRRVNASPYRELHWIINLPIVHEHAFYSLITPP